MSAFAHAGTLIHGTHRLQDLVPAYMGKLEELDADRASAIAAQYPVTLANLEGDHFLAGAQLLEDLTDALDALAPEGWYFGALEGDGADFGFWQCEEADRG